jgi:hypothetical protein
MKGLHTCPIYFPSTYLWLICDQVSCFLFVSEDELDFSEISSGSEHETVSLGNVAIAVELWELPQVKYGIYKMNLQVSDQNDSESATVYKMYFLRYYRVG